MIDLVHDWGGFRVNLGLVYTNVEPVVHQPQDSQIDFSRWPWAPTVQLPWELDTDDCKNCALCNPGRTYHTFSATQVRSGHSD